MVGLGDLLIQVGDVTRGRRLLEATLAAMDHEEAIFGTGGLWNYQLRSVALALLGHNDESIATLQSSIIERPGMSS